MFKENKRYKIPADLCQISIYSYFEKCMACIRAQPSDALT